MGYPTPPPELQKAPITSLPPRPCRTPLPSLPESGALGRDVRQGPLRETGDWCLLEVRGWCRVAQTYILPMHTQTHTHSDSITSIADAGGKNPSQEVAILPVHSTSIMTSCDLLFHNLSFRSSRGNYCHKVLELRMSTEALSFLILSLRTCNNHHSNCIF